MLIVSSIHDVSRFFAAVSSPSYLRADRRDDNINMSFFERCNNSICSGAHPDIAPSKLSIVWTQSFLSIFRSKSLRFVRNTKPFCRNQARGGNHCRKIRGTDIFKMNMATHLRCNKFSMVLPVIVRHFRRSHD
jgi:hypothetical protein